MSAALVAFPLAPSERDGSAQMSFPIKTMSPVSRGTALAVRAYNSGSAAASEALRRRIRSRAADFATYHRADDCAGTAKKKWPLPR
jgi:hypothetical protein